MDDLPREAREATEMLAGLKVRLVQRHRPSELLIEFENGTRLIIDAQGALDLLGRPIVDRIHSSRHQSMKELRVAKGGALRVLFCFDPRRQAILLLGATRRVLGMSGTSGRSRSPMTCTTNISTNFERKD